jgi:hypothetical protein
MRSQAVCWFVLVMYALSLYLCGAAADHYNSYAVQFAMTAVGWCRRLWASRLFSG